MTGHHRIIVKYNGVAWSFALAGGSNRILSTYAPIAANGSTKLNEDLRYTVMANDLPPLGCTVEVIPTDPMTTSTRIDQFRVTDTVTGNSRVLIFSLAPFVGIPSTVESPTGELAYGTDVEIDLVYYRLPDVFRCLGYGISFGAPEYSILDYSTAFTSDGMTNPLDDNLTHEFTRVSGQQTIAVKNDDSGFYFSIDVDYGIMGQGLGYPGYIGPQRNATDVGDPVNCVIDSIEGLWGKSLDQAVKYSITTSAPDSKSYAFIFYPVATNPTIQLLAPGSLADESVTLHVYSRVFATI